GSARLLRRVPTRRPARRRRPAAATRVLDHHGGDVRGDLAPAARHRRCVRAAPSDRRSATMSNAFDGIDFFTGDALVADPFHYFEALREQCPVQREHHHDVVMVTGYDEAVAVYNDTDTFSSCTSVTGPFPGFPVPLE